MWEGTLDKRVKCDKVALHGVIVALSNAWPGTMLGRQLNCHPNERRCPRTVKRLAW